MKSIISLIVVTAAFLFSQPSLAAGNPELQCSIVDTSSGYPGTWKNNCYRQIQYGDSAFVQFRIVGLPSDAFSYYWTGNGKNFNPDSFTGSLHTGLGGGTVKVVVFTESGTTYSLKTTYGINSSCPNCQIP